MLRAFLPFSLLIGPVLMGACREPETSPFPQGWSWGRVSHQSAIFWIRGKGEMRLELELSTPAGPRRRTLDLSAAKDFIGRARFDDLRPDFTYRGNLFWKDPEQPHRKKKSWPLRFRTAPAPDQPHPVRFVFGGDLGGQNACRDLEHDYPVFRQIAGHNPDFFLGLGDMIYADDLCKETGRFGNRQIPDPILGTDLESFRAKWRYNRSSHLFQDLLRETPYLAIWDDHEVINDFHSETRGTTGPYDPDLPLFAPGLQAFREYHPVAQDGPLYHSQRYGANLELFVLDTRSYRDPQTAPDSKRRPKTMLGPAQLRWFKDALRASDARRKIIVSSVPIAVPTGKSDHARDGWANYRGETGYENELGDLFKFLAREKIQTTWISTDVHFAVVYRYHPFSDRPDFQIHEFVTGPLNAGLFPNQAFDETFNPEQLFFHGPDSAGSVTEWDRALGWFNYGLVEIDAAGAMKISIIDAKGKVLYDIDVP